MQGGQDGLPSFGLANLGNGNAAMLPHIPGGRLPSPPSSDESTAESYKTVSGSWNSDGTVELKHSPKKVPNKPDSVLPDDPFNLNDVIGWRVVTGLP